MEEAATYLILEWVEKLFNEKMDSIRDLALFLIEKMYVDNRSVAAHALMSSTTSIKEGIYVTSVNFIFKSILPE